MSPTIPQQRMSGGEAIARMLQAHSVGPMFGMGGFQLLPFYDAARRLGLSHFLVDDERTGAFAADAYAKVTGRVGVVDATLGPGATNLVTGLVEALNSGSPLLAIVGDSHRMHSGKHMTQESHQVEILRPACKALIRIEQLDRIPELERRAFQIATSGRPGPVVLDIPEDIAHAEMAFTEDDFRADPRFSSAPSIRTRPADADLHAAADLIRSASRPVILAGGGVHLSGSAEALTSFAERLGVPVAHTLTGKGVIPDGHALSMGLFGRYDRIANSVIDSADLLILAGCKMGEIATKRYSLPPATIPVIHIEIAAEEFGRTIQPTVPLWGDVRDTIRELSRELQGDAGRIAGRTKAHRDEVERLMASWQADTAPRLESPEQPIAMTRLLGEINMALPADGILVADGGFAAHWAGLLFDTKRAGRAFIADRGFASIGYGVPGAIGAALASPNSAVLALTGDGGFLMSMGALETAKRLNLNMTIVIVNNAASGYVKALQHLAYGPSGYHASDLSDLDFAAVAGSLGCQSHRVEDPAGLASALERALTETGPSVIDVAVTRDAGRMLPAVDSRVLAMRPGDRVA